MPLTNAAAPSRRLPFLTALFAYFLILLLFFAPAFGAHKISAQVDHLYQFYPWRGLPGGERLSQNHLLADQSLGFLPFDRFITASLRRPLTALESLFAWRHTVDCQPIKRLLLSAELALFCDGIGQSAGLDRHCQIDGRRVVYLPVFAQPRPFLLGQPVGRLDLHVVRLQCALALSSPHQCRHFPAGSALARRAFSAHTLARVTRPAGIGHRLSSTSAATWKPPFTCCWRSACIS